ncbi:phenylalanine--tRNA ligase beta subunit-related protein [Streptococcus pseudopneumoniae]|uniref:phenylalanine--tRNA ligase beta subunit-related protein n=1 Tax=Streptococcus pseudopneumoniae TaxID=257758 RepID=UPI00066C0F83
MKEKEWRQVFTKFKTKKGTRSSIEALLKRVSQGREFNLINHLVDIYNSVHFLTQFLVGGEDLAKIVGDFLEEHEGMNPSSTRD